MKRFYPAFFLFLCILFVFPVIFSSPLFATSYQSGNNVTISSGSTLNDTLYTAGQDIQVNDNVNGDVICAGQSVTINGKVKGDVICAGQTITINGSVSGSIRIAGQTVNLGGSVGGNVSVLGQDVLLTSGFSTPGDFSVAGQNVTINGSIGRDVFGAINTIALNGKIGRNVQIRDTELTFGNGATIGGNLDYTSDQNIIVPHTANVKGSVVRHTPSQSNISVISGGLWFSGFLFGLLAYGLIGLILLFLFYHRLENIVETMQKSPLASFGWGIVGTIIIPFICVLLFITIIGIPLSLMISVLWIIALLISRIFFAYWLGVQIMRLLGQTTIKIPIYPFIIGMIVAWLIFSLPVLGGLISLLAVLWAFGAMLVSFKNNRQRGELVQEVAAK